VSFSGYASRLIATKRRLMLARPAIRFITWSNVDRHRQALRCDLRPPPDLRLSTQLTMIIGGPQLS
jgi:hypothetical protein